MDFKVILQSAKKWVETSKSGLELVGVDESERKLTFSCGAVDLTFYVIHNDSTTDTAKWRIWSDTENKWFQTMLQLVDSAKEITDVLNYVHEELKPLPLFGASDDDSTDYMAESSDEDCQGSHRNPDCSAAAVAPKSEDTEPVDNERNFVVNSVAARRLLQDLKSMKQSEKFGVQFGVQGFPRGDDLLFWDVKLFDFEKETKLLRDLLRFAKRCKCEPAVYLEMQFPSNYPMEPPFVRVVKPRFLAFTGDNNTTKCPGRMLVDGSLCIEMLTKSGWTPAYDVESILVQIRAEIMSDAWASLDLAKIDGVYHKQYAHTTFNEIVTRYGWNKP